MTKEEFIQLVKDTRKRTGLTTTGLGGKIGVSFITIYRWEKGSSIPKEDSIQYWASALRMVDRDVK